jgi:hypothetical protein
MFSVGHNHEGEKVMKSNLFGKLSAGVAGVALMAIGVVSTPVQAATIGFSFFDRNSMAQASNPLYDGSLSWDSSKSGIDSISALNLVVHSPNGPVSAGRNNVTSVSYSGNTLTVNLTSGTDTIQLQLDGLSQDGKSSPYTTDSRAPQIDRLPGGSISINNSSAPIRYNVPEPSTYVGTILAFGALGAVKTLKRKQKKLDTFTP